MRKSRSEAERGEILRRQGCRCAYGDICHMPDLSNRPFELDHKLAFALGGDDTSENLQALCLECHANKTRLDMEACALRRRLEALRTKVASVAAACDGMMRSMGAWGVAHDAAGRSEVQIGGEEAPPVVATAATGAVDLQVTPALPAATPASTAADGSLEQARTRRRARFSIPTNAKPFDDPVFQDSEKWARAVRRKGGFDRFLSDHEATALVRDIRGSLHRFHTKEVSTAANGTVKRRSDNYFFHAETNKRMRSAAGIATHFLRLRRMDTSFVRGRRRKRDDR